MKNIFNKAIAVITIGWCVTSCSTEETEVLSDIIINNDPSLNERVTLKDEEIDVISSDNGRIQRDFTLTLVAELTPPSIDGKVLQATSMARRKDFLAVSYNFAGQTYAGAIDLVNKNLELKSQILFNDADINEIAFSGNRVYFVGGTSSSDRPAFVERINFDLESESFIDDRSKREEVGSFTANSVLTFSSKVFLTSGNDAASGGGIYQLNKGLNRLNFQEIQDVRWVTPWKNSVYTVSGNPAKVQQYNKDDLSLEFEFEHQALNEEESKMTIDVNKNLIFVAGGKQGLLIYDLNGTLLKQFTFEGNFTTNAVSARNNRAFVSNGEGGVYVIRYKDEIQVLGKLDLGTGASANHVLQFEGHLYIASGLGGIKMIDIKNR